ncbi:MAG: DUF2628 domain-containing protein [Pseudomonadota bacterium]
MDTNPYAPPGARLDLHEGAHGEPDGDISETELIAFAGAGRYPRLLQRRLCGAARLAGFNLWAALFGIQWFFFRKLYMFGLASLVLETLSVFAVQLAVAYGNHPGRVAGLLALALALRALIGFMANIALCLKADMTIRRIDALNLDNEEHLRQIGQAGGISMPSLLGIYLVLGILNRWH